MSRTVTVVVALLAGTLLVGAAVLRSLVVARRQVEMTVINDTSEGLHSIVVTGTDVPDLGAGERVTVTPSARQPTLWGSYFDDRGESHFSRSFDCFGECSYWPACSRPIVHIRNDGAAFEDGPPPSPVVQYLLRCE